MALAMCFIPLIPTFSHPGEGAGVAYTSPQLRRAPRSLTRAKSRAERVGAALPQAQKLRGHQQGGHRDGDPEGERPDDRRPAQHVRGAEALQNTVPQPHSARNSRERKPS